MMQNHLMKFSMFFSYFNNFPASHILFFTFILNISLLNINYSLLILLCNIRQLKLVIFGVIFLLFTLIYTRLRLNTLYSSLRKLAQRSKNKTQKQENK